MVSVIWRHLRIVRRWWVNCEARNQRQKDLRTNGWLSIGLDPADHKSILITFLIFSFCFFNDGHGGKSLNCKEWSSAGHVYIIKETANYTYVKRTSIIVTDCWIAPAARGSLLLPTVVFVVWHCGWARQHNGVSWDMETKSLPLWSSQGWLSPNIWTRYLTSVQLIYIYMQNQCIDTPLHKWVNNCCQKQPRNNWNVALSNNMKC